MALANFLGQLVEKYHRPEWLSSDPLEFVHRYSDPRDQEAAALCAALLAYGNVRQIRASVEALLARLHAFGGSPSGAVMRAGDAAGWKELRAALRGWKHRFNTGDDLALLLRLLALTWNSDGSLGAYFCSRLSPEDTTIEGALDRTIADWKKLAREQNPRALRTSFAYLLTAPSDGSACKRWCMLLRWMGRKDEVDPGLWPGLPARLLILPLDTHTGRISQYLGLTRRKSLGWLAAVEVTESLRKLRPEDPTIYDFALARLGILDLCQKRYRAEICEKCELLTVCHFAQKNRRVS